MTTYTLRGWGDGTGKHAFPGLLEMDYGLRDGHPIDGVAHLALDTGTTVGETRYLMYHTTPGDGGHGWVRRTASGATVNNGTVFTCGDGGTARWERVLEGEITVPMFGAKTSANIAAALVAANALGIGRVRAPAGTYSITAAIPAVSNVELVGDGYSAVFNLAASVHCITIGAISNFAARNFKIQGNRATYTSVDNIGVYATGGGFSGITVDGVWVNNWGGSGIVYQATVGSRGNNCQIKNCRVTDVGAYPIASLPYVDHCTIKDNYVEGYGLVAADCPGITTGRYAEAPITTGNIVVGGGSLGVSAQGISIDLPDSRAITNGNTVKDTVGYGIELVQVRDGTCSGNTVVGGDRAGISINGAGNDPPPNMVDGLVVANNSISGGGSHGIYGFVGAVTNSAIDFNTTVTIMGNIIQGVGDIGIWLDRFKHVVVASNQINDSVHSGIYFTNCDAVTLDGNRGTGNNTSNSATHCGVAILTMASPKDWVIKGNRFINNLNANYIFMDENGNAIGSRFVAGDTTPTVVLDDGSYFTQNSSATTITDLDDGYEGQRVTIRFGDTNTTIQHNTARIRLAGGVNMTGANNQLLTLVRNAGNWWEAARVTAA